MAGLRGGQYNRSGLFAAGTVKVRQKDKPTNVIEKDGKYYAIINSRTNSTCALIQNEVTFADASGKWYEAAVNKMGSRKIIEGRSTTVFDGGASIPRAERATIILRLLQKAELVDVRS